MYINWPDDRHFDGLGWIVILCCAYCDLPNKTQSRKMLSIATTGDVFRGLADVRPFVAGVVQGAS